MDEKERIENAYRAMYEAMVKKDRDSLSAVLEDGFVLLHMTGMQQSKDAFIRAVEDGTLNYYSAVHEHFDIAVHGDLAELIGQSVVNAAVFGGGRHTWRLQLACKLKKYNNHWKITEARASTW